MWLSIIIIIVVVDDCHFWLFHKIEKINPCFSSSSKEKTIIIYHMGLKGGAIGNTLGNTLNLIGTHWELGDKGKMKKIPPLPNPNPNPPKTPPQNLKEKKSGHFECMLSIPIGCMKFLVPKWFALPGLIPP
jgi:hypothetical protein